MQDEMLFDFLRECDELYIKIEQAIINIELNVDVYENYEEIFRAFHSIKGAAAMFELEQLYQHMLFFENLINEKKASLMMSKELSNYILEGIYCAKKIQKGTQITFCYIDPDKTNKSKKSLFKKIITIFKKE